MERSQFTHRRAGTGATYAAGQPSSGVRDLPRVVALGGGAMIQVGLGVSGVPTGEADEACARAGVAAIRDELEF